jgi:hypothetical protein
VNAPNFVDWAITNGANALEMDLQFDANGVPTEFWHGAGFCDNLACGGLNLNKPVCWTRASTHDVLDKARQPQTALIIIDSKIDSLSPTALVQAGQQVVNLLIKEVFTPVVRPYLGNVLIGCGKTSGAAYIQSAISAVPANLRDRIVFTFDEMDDNSPLVLQTLANLGTTMRVFGTGISACSPATYYGGILKGRGLEDIGSSGFTYIWTLDKSSSMKQYLDLGARGIITNSPDVLRDLYQSLGKRLARPSERFCPATSSVFGNCDCNWQVIGFGCKIVQKAPPGFACHCERFVTSCEGKIVSCDQSKPLCQNPDTSEAACKLGGGNCDGY